MASQFDSWESYFYPDTIDPLTGIGTLRNLYDERDARVLSRMEYTDTTVRAVQLGNGEVDVPRTFDGEHLRAIHGHLFQDVYEWAGEYRTVEMSKGPGRGFGEVKTGEVDRYLSDAQRLVTSTDWAGISRNDFVATASTVFAYVNQAHPFREGNGRTSKVFMAHVAEQSPYRFDFARVSPEQWNAGSAMSRPDMFSYAPEPASLVPVFAAVTVDRTAVPPAPDRAAQARSALSASYPRPAVDATKQTPQQGTQARRGSAGYRTDRGSGRE
ncbi:MULTISPECIES: Fic/DOC family protein [Micrococcales]|uniref:Fic/DOC family protein n=1 Tax=Micrococcales TaxID=85006 RepID=UPI0021A81CB6|nr:Fic family protein [Microbacterium paraoxydans]MCT2224649.1 Fic family protein [Microbacterium paraoxydans]